MSSPAFNVTEEALLIRAGAGAGKTTTLIRTFLQFCEEFDAKKGRLPRIAITTFTRKATQEVKERLSVKALEKKDEKLFQHINKKSAVHISTIHGLLTLFIQDNADLLGLPQNIKVLDSHLYKKNLKKVLRHTIKSETKYLEILEHYSFVRLADYVLQGLEGLRQCPDFKILTADELKKNSLAHITECDHILSDVLSEMTAVPANWSEYHSFLKLLADSLKSRNIEDVLELVEEKPRKPVFSKKNPPFPESAHAQLESFWEQFDLSLCDSTSYFEQHQNLNQLFLDLCKEMLEQDRNRKLSTGEITINDLELFSLELVRNHPQALADFSERFDYYMIDEFQDTSPIQVEILDALISAKPHFIVGDPQQSIYLFRGARSEVFYQKQEVAKTGTEKLKMHLLETNYRSAPSLMHFINDFFTRMSPQFSPMLTNPSQNLEKVVVKYLQSENEAQAALGYVTELLKSGVSAKDICILSRKNASLMKVAALAQKHQIPVQLQVSAGFDSKREILDLICILKFLVNPHDNENLVTLLRSPWAHLSDFKIAEAAAKSQGRSLWSVLIQSLAAEKSVQALQKYFINYQKIGVSESLIQFVEETGFLDFTKAYDSSGKREANFWKLFTHLKNAETQVGFTLGRFISENFQNLQSDLGSSQSEAIPVAQPDRVSLMTIHASKGLEFSHVIVLGFSEPPQTTTHWPLAIDLKNQKMSLAPFVVSESKIVSSRWSSTLRKEFNRLELFEHERLLYVAMTRAQNGLALIAEDRARPHASSWLKRTQWLEEGQHDFENYLIHSERSKRELEYAKAAAKTKVTVRSKLQYNTDLKRSQSVTDSLDIGVEPSVTGVNYQNKIGDILKAKKGTDMHRLFESLQIYTSSSDLMAQLQNTLSVEQSKAVDYLLKQSKIPLKDIIKHGYAEWGFGLKTPKGILQGQIDLWGIVNNEAYILDYKTGSSGYAQKAFQQLSFYAHCLYQMKLIHSNMKLHFAVTYPFEQLTLTESFSGFSDFNHKTDPVVLKIFNP